MKTPQPSTIPTVYKGDLAKGTSYPGGAQMFTAALQETPQISVLQIAFQGPIAPSALNESGFRRLIEVSYRKLPPSLSSDDEDRWGWREANWTIFVHPLLSKHRSLAREYLDTEGFSLIRHWLRESWHFHEREGKASATIEFESMVPEFRFAAEESVDPAR